MWSVCPQDFKNNIKIEVPSFSFFFFPLKEVIYRKGKDKVKKKEKGKREKRKEKKRKREEDETRQEVPTTEV